MLHDLINSISYIITTILGNYWHHLTQWPLGDFIEIFDKQFSHWCYQFMGISFEVVHRWLLQDFTDDKSTPVQVVAWCRQTASPYLSRCCPRSLSPYGVTRPQWVKYAHGYKIKSSDNYLYTKRIQRYDVCQSLKHARLCFFCKRITPLFCRRYFFNSFFYYESYYISIKISLQFLEKQITLVAMDLLYIIFTY